MQICVQLYRKLVVWLDDWFQQAVSPLFGQRWMPGCSAFKAWAKGQCKFLPISFCDWFQIRREIRQIPPEFSLFPLSLFFFFFFKYISRITNVIETWRQNRPSIREGEGPRCSVSTTQLFQSINQSRWNSWLWGIYHGLIANSFVTHVHHPYQMFCPYRPRCLLGEPQLPTLRCTLLLGR